MSQHIPIVIVTDEDSANLIRDAVEKSGINTIITGVAQDLDEGCQIIHNERPMVAILEISRDEMAHSLQMIRKISHELPGIVIFVVCDDSSPETIFDFMKAGAHEYFLKPLSESDLSGAFRKLGLRVKERGDIDDEPECKTYSVFSTKNGVGATTIAVNLAANIFEVTKEPTVLVDLDLTGGDVTTFLDLEPAFTLSDIKKNITRVDKNFLQGVITKHESGISILAAPQDVKEGLLISSSEVTKMLDLLRTMFKHIVLDTEANFTQSTMTAIRMSDLILMPFVMSLPSTKNTKKCLEHLKEIGFDGEKIRLVANRYLENVQIRIEEAEEILGRPIFCHIPNDFTAAMACLNKGITLSAYDPASALNESMRELAIRLTGTAPELSMAPAGVSVPGMQRLFRVTSQIFRNFVSI